MPYDLEFERPLQDLEKRIGSLRRKGDRLKAEERQQIRELEVEFRRRLEEIYASLSRWDRVQLARHRDRPYTADYIKLMCEEFFELYGDRRYADDRAILAGLAAFAGRTVMLIGHQKGRDTAEKAERNFGMPRPEGYRKAQRLMRHAEKFGFPVVSLIDTAGAYLDLESEQRGQAQAIAESLEIMATLRVPIVAIVIGEGGSGGALALGLADRVYMLEYSIYTVASPEAAASILWRDTAFAAEAAEAMRITAPDLLELGVIDGIIREPLGGAHRDHRGAAQALDEQLQQALAELDEIPIAELLEQRYAKYRRIGHFAVV
jgi:acetyl-CoA carboxylase carboxyl transferase subunit alpha